MAGPGILDAHQRPPNPMRTLFKWVQKSSHEVLSASPDVLDFGALTATQLAKLDRLEDIDTSQMASIFAEFLHTAVNPEPRADSSDFQSTTFGIKALPGLFIIPSLLSPAVQIELLNKLLHRDLGNPAHKTNLDLHYNIPREPNRLLQAGPSGTSFFTVDPGHTFGPKDPAVHKPVSVEQVLGKKLRWMTLGGQYDWTAKKYPSEIPPAFPADIRGLLRGLFPDIDAQAAIVNLYSPGDTLSVHRDVSEECDRGLISLSIGCDGIFILGNEDGSRTAAVRLRSGDAVLMTGESRFSWHAVPKILPNTCPEWLRDWPRSVETNHQHDRWKGWMSSKRINLNVRQMRDEHNSFAM